MAKTPPQKPSGKEKRQHYRASKPKFENPHAEIQFDPDSDPWIVEIVNLSLGGVLICEFNTERRPPRMGLFVDVRIHFGEGETLQTIGRILHREPNPEGDGGFRLGVRFMDLQKRQEHQLTSVISRWQRAKRREDLEEAERREQERERREKETERREAKERRQFWGDLPRPGGGNPPKRDEGGGGFFF